MTTFIYIHTYREGIETMREYSEGHSDKSISSNSLCNFASIIWKNNYFAYEELKYHQERGFPIGTKFTPPYANLFIAGLEKIIFQNSEFELFLWLGYLGNIFCIWTQGSQN